LTAYALAFWVTIMGHGNGILRRKESKIGILSAVFFLSGNQYYRIKVFSPNISSVLTAYQSIIVLSNAFLKRIFVTKSYPACALGKISTPLHKQTPEKQQDLDSRRLSEEVHST
jgi:hypothetical protein